MEESVPGHEEPLEAPKETPQRPPVPKKRRWKKILLITGGTFLVLILLVALAGPPVISAVARSQIVAVLSEQFRADVACGDVSFSWSGRVEIENLRIVPEGFTDPLFEVEKVTVDVALGRALGGAYVADVEIVGPRVRVEKSAEGKFNYEVPGPAEEKPPDEASELPFVQAKVRVRGGEIFVRGGGEETRFRNITLDAEVDTFEKPVRYTLTLENPSHGKLSLKGAYDLTKKSGPVSVTLERISLRNLVGAARAFSPVRDLDGVLDGKLEYELREIPGFEGSGKLEVRGLALGVEGKALNLDRLLLTHTGGLDGSGSGTHTITLSSGRALEARISARVADALDTPRIRTDLILDSDLAVLREMLRGFMPPGDRTGIAGTAGVRGKIETVGPSREDREEGTFAVSGSWDLEANVGDLRLQLEAGSVRAGDLRCALAGSMDEKGSGRSSISFDAGKALSTGIVADVTDAFGDPAVRARVTAKSDLAALGEILRGFISLKEGMQLRGAASVEGDLELKGVGSARCDLEITANDLAAVNADGKRIEIDTASIVKLVGSWDSERSRAALETLKVDSTFASIDARGAAAFGEKLEIGASSLSLDADLRKLGEKLSELLENAPDLDGKAAVTAKFSSKSVDVDGSVENLKVAGVGPFDATLKHEGTFDEEGTGRHAFRIKAGEALEASVTADVTKAFDADRSVRARILVGSDLASLGDAFPDLAAMTPGRKLAGRAELSGRVDLEKGGSVGFDLSARLKGLEAVDAETGERQAIEESARLDAAGAWRGPERSLDLVSCELESSAASFRAKGGFSLSDSFLLKESDADLEVDLGKLGPKLKVFLQDPPGLAGTVKVGAKLVGERFDSKVFVKGLEVTREKEDGQQVVTGPIEATLLQKGTLKAGEEGALRIETWKLTSSAVEAGLTGEIASVTEKSRHGSLDLDVVVHPSGLSAWLNDPDLVLGGLDVRLDAKLGVASGGATLSGQMARTSVTLEDSSEVKRTAKMEPVDFRLELKGEEIAARMKTALFQWITPDYSAKGTFESEVTYGSKVTTGKTRIGDLEVVAKGSTVKDPSIEITHNVELSPAAMVIRKGEISSSFLRGSVTGEVKGLQTEPEFVNVRGAFHYVPDRLGAVLAPWLPGKLEGAEERKLDLRLDGKARSTDLLAILRGARGTAELDIARFTNTGISVTGRTRLDLEGGRAVSATPVEVNSGRTDLTLLLDFREEEKKPSSLLEFKADGSRANADMGPLLEKISPIFHTVNGSVDGLMQADFRLGWQGLLDPGEKDWKTAATKALGGTGTFAVRNLKVSGSPTVAKILSVLGLKDRLEGELLATNIRVGQGRCSYQNMTLRLGRYELRFSGWVGFDRSMELMVEMPMTEHMVRKHAGLARYLGKTFFVPLRGTVDSPTFHFERAIQELLKRSVENVLKDKAKDLLEDKAKDLLEGLFKKK